VGALSGAGGGPHDLGDPRWRLEMLRGRGGRPGAWNLVWRAAAEALELDQEGAEEEAISAAVPQRRRRGTSGAR
jgi:protein ImuA